MGGRRAHGSQKGNRRRELPDQFDCGYQVLAKPAIAQILLKPIPFLSPPLPFQASSSHPSCLYQTLEAFAGPSNSHPRHYVRPFLPPDHIARRDTRHKPSLGLVDYTHGTRSSAIYVISMIFVDLKLCVFTVGFTSVRSGGVLREAG